MSGFAARLQPYSMSDVGINMCLYADNGTGKSGVIGTSPEAVILLADPGGTNTCASMGQQGLHTVITKWDELDDAEDYFRNDPAAKKHKWVWLDSLSVWSDVGLESVMTDLVARKAHRKVYLPDKGEYGENMNRIKLFVRHMCNLPINFGFTAHPVRVEDETTGEVQYLPFIQGRNMPQTLCGMMDVIGYMRIQQVKGEDKQVVHFKKKDMFYAKDRFGALPAAMADPTIPKIESLIRQRLAAVNRPARKAATKRVAKKSAVVRRRA